MRVPARFIEEILDRAEQTHIEECLRQHCGKK
jgi:hypothetical protein